MNIFNVSAAKLIIFYLILTQHSFEVFLDLRYEKFALQTNLDEGLCCRLSHLSLLQWRTVLSGCDHI